MCAVLVLQFPEAGTPSRTKSTRRFPWPDVRNPPVTGALQSGRRSCAACFVVMLLARNLRGGEPVPVQKDKTVECSQFSWKNRMEVPNPSAESPYDLLHSTSPQLYLLGTLSELVLLCPGHLHAYLRSPCGTGFVCVANLNSGRHQITAKRAGAQLPSEAD